MSSTIVSSSAGRRYHELVSERFVAEDGEEIRTPSAEHEGEMSLPEKRILCIVTKPSEPLAYPVRKTPMPDGTYEVEYVIPQEDKQRVLDELNRFERKLKAGDEAYCIHEEKTFRLDQCRVIRWNGRNFLVSPWYDKSGGTILDWQDPEDAEGAKKCGQTFLVATGEALVTTTVE